jgi:hypothetical protein
MVALRVVHPIAGTTPRRLLKLATLLTTLPAVLRMASMAPRHTKGPRMHLVLWVLVVLAVLALAAGMEMATRLRQVPHTTLATTPSSWLPCRTCRSANELWTHPSEASVSFDMIQPLDTNGISSIIALRLHWFTFSTHSINYTVSRSPCFLCDQFHEVFTFIWFKKHAATASCNSSYHDFLSRLLTF